MKASKQRAREQARAEFGRLAADFLCDFLMDDGQDELEDPCGHAQRMPYSRIHSQYIERAKGLMRLLAAAGMSGTRSVKARGA